MTVGNLLLGFQKRVDSCMQQAVCGDIAAYFEIEAGRRLSIAIGNTESSFVDILSHSQSKVERYIQSRLNELESYIIGLEKRGHSILEMRKLTKIYTKGLFVGKNHLPYLQKISPRLIDLSAPDTAVQIAFLGNFNYASNRTYLPFLEINNAIYKPVRADTYCLNFTFNIDQLKAPYTPATLTIPYESGWFGCCRPRIKTSVFKVWIGTTCDSSTPLSSSDDAECFGSLFESEQRVPPEETYQNIDI